MIKRPKKIVFNLNQPYGASGPGQTLSMSYKKKGDKAINVRGGFTSGWMKSPSLNSIAQAAGKAAGGDVSGAFQQMGKEILAQNAEQPLSTVLKAVSSFNDAKNAAGKKPVTHRKRSHETLPNGQPLVNEVAVVKSTGLDSLHSAVHKIMCVTGRPTSKSLKRIAKDNGVMTQRIFDTRAQNNTPDVTRQQLTNSSGFNLRQFFIPPTRSFVTYSDLFRFLNQDTKTLNKPDGSVARVYASVLDATTEFAIFNQSQNVPMNLKIHLVNRLSPSAVLPNRSIAMDEIVERALWVNPKVVDPQTVAKSAGKVPSFYQESAVSVDQPSDPRNKSAHWEHSLKGKGLLDSTFFRQQFRIEKTFSKTIKPTDLLIFRHTHHFGGGVDMLKAQQYDKDASSEAVLDVDMQEPISDYFYIIEAKGAQNVELVYQRDATNFDPYIGVAPTFYLVDFRKTLRYVKSSDSLGATGDAIVTTPMHARIFFEDPIFDVADAITTEFRVKSENIAYNSGTGMGVGKAFFTSMTDAVFSTQSATITQNTKDPGT